MARKRENSDGIPDQSPASTIEGRENQMIALAVDEAERLLRPVLDHLREMESDADIVMQHEIIGMVAKIGRFVPESALGLLRNIFSNTGDAKSIGYVT